MIRNTIFFCKIKLIKLIFTAIPKSRIVISEYEILNDCTSGSIMICKKSDTIWKKIRKQICLFIRQRRTDDLPYIIFIKRAPFAQWNSNPVCIITPIISLRRYSQGMKQNSIELTSNYTRLNTHKTIYGSRESQVLIMYIILNQPSHCNNNIVSVISVNHIICITKSD
eukprot:NODE_139_length_16235_cov_0.569038.p10 type:complete len:168 gc:universal NODE_139_length_16235_cov_0.569038:9931-9428(-)